MDFMLQLASQHRDVFEALLSAYADIGAALPRFDRYEKAFKENIEFQNVLATVYSGILDFHQRAYKFFRRRGMHSLVANHEDPKHFELIVPAWHILFLSLWKDFQSRFSSIIDDLKKQRDFVDMEAASIDMAEAKFSRAQLQDEIQHRKKQSLMILESNETNARVARLQHAVAWLDGRDQHTHYERISSRRHDGACKWIMTQSQMESWIRKDAKDPLLWLSGKPGAGMTLKTQRPRKCLTW